MKWWWNGLFQGENERILVSTVLAMSRQRLFKLADLPRIEHQNPSFRRRPPLQEELSSGVSWP